MSDAGLLQAPPKAIPAPSARAEGVRSKAEPPSRWLELGLGLVVIAAPLSFIPATAAPFVEVKLALVVVGALAVWAGHRGRSPLAAPAAAWVAVVALAATLGVDRWWSVAGPENTGNGVVLLGASAALLVAGTQVPGGLRDRIPLWLVGTSTASVAVALAYRLSPGAFDRVVAGLSFEGGTLGHQVFLAALAATGLVAAVGLVRLRPIPLAAVLVVLSSGLALSTKRIGWVALVVGLAVALWKARPPRARTMLIVGVVAATLAGWTAVDAVTDPAVPLSGAGRFGELTTDSARARVTALEVLGRGWARRPVLGWGPGNTWSAFVSSATEAESEVATRGYGDAHNLVAESAVTTGALGLAALLALAGLTVRQVRRGRPGHGWALGGAAALAVYHLFQPVNVSLTPLLFLLAGLACPAPDRPTDRPSGPKGPVATAARATPAILLAGGLVVALAVLAASVLEQHGRTHASEWSLRAAVRITPGRVSAAEALALHLALDGRAGDRAAAREAMDLAERTVERHPWNPGVRLAAADIHMLLRDLPGALRWVDRHLGRFPGDPIPRPGAPREPTRLRS